MLLLNCQLKGSLAFRVLVREKRSCKLLTPEYLEIKNNEYS